MTALIELKDLAVRTPDRFLVDGVNMVVQPRRVTALIGPSGSGKSLTARCCMGVVDVVPGLTGSADPEVLYGVLQKVDRLQFTGSAAMYEALLLKAY